MNPEDVLEICLEEIAAGRLTVRECAARYPEVAGLADQLQAAQHLKAVATPERDPAVSSAWEARLRAAARARINAVPVTAAPVPSLNGHRPPVRPTRLRWASRVNARAWAPALAVVVALVLASAGTVSAAGNSLPGEWLYPLKRSTESLRLGVTPPGQRAGLHTTLAWERSDELLAVAGRPVLDVALVNALTVDMLNESQAALAAVDEAPAAAQTQVLERLVATLAHEQAVLSSLSARLPDAAQAGLRRAQAATGAHQSQAEQARAEAAEAAATDRPPRQTQPAPTATQTVAAANNQEPTQAVVVPTRTSRPTHEPQPTHTDRPTFTPRPTHTPRPTFTPRPTRTPRPTNENRPTREPRPTDEPKPTKESRPGRSS